MNRFHGCAGRAALPRSRAVSRAGADHVARCRAAAGQDRGSGAILVVSFAVVLLGLAAFVVDGGLSIAQRERAADIAEQAARYAAQDIDEEALRERDVVQINRGSCESRVADFVSDIRLTSAAVSRTRCTAVTGDEVSVEVRVTYRPVFTGLFYDRPLTVSGTATAEARTE